MSSREHLFHALHLKVGKVKQLFSFFNRENTVADGFAALVSNNND